MLLKDVKEYLKQLIDCDAWAISRRNSKAEKSITLYDTTSLLPAPTICIGGLHNTKTATKGVSILVHWGTNPTEAELKADTIYKAFYGMDYQTYISHYQIIKTELRTGQPVFVGMDSQGIYEYVIDVAIYYNK